MVVLVANSVLDVDASQPIPAGIALHQNYPNPIVATQSGSSIFGYELNHRATVDLSIYDQLGRRIAVIASGLKEAGTYTASFTPGPTLPSGTYSAVLRVTDGGKVEMRARGFVVINY